MHWSEIVYWGWPSYQNPQWRLRGCAGILRIPQDRYKVQSRVCDPKKVQEDVQMAGEEDAFYNVPYLQLQRLSFCPILSCILNEYLCNHVFFFKFRNDFAQKLIWNVILYSAFSSEGCKGSNTDEPTTILYSITWWER